MSNRDPADLLWALEDCDSEVLERWSTRILKHPEAWIYINAFRGIAEVLALLAVADGLRASFGVLAAGSNDATRIDIGILTAGSAPARGESDDVRLTFGMSCLLLFRGLEAELSE